MQATQAEFGTTPGQDYIKSLFSDIPSDVRFSSVKYEPVPPNTAIDANTTQIIYTLHPKENPACYLIGDMLMKLQVTIRKADGTSLPNNESFVGPGVQVIKLFKMTAVFVTVGRAPGACTIKLNNCNLLPLCM